MIYKVSKPHAEGRRAMYYPQGQEEAHRSGAYAYLDSIAMAPRFAAIASYVKHFAAKKVLDIGCGTGQLLAYLDGDVTYHGVDISRSAIEAAKQRFAERPNAQFHQCEFRDWQCPDDDFDGIVWAGIGYTWTLQGRGGSHGDWLDILTLAERRLKSDGLFFLELVTQHWPTLERLVEGRYTCEAGCDLDCFQSEESPRRSVRVLRRQGPPGVWPITLGHAGTSLVPSHVARELISYAEGMGQMADERSCNLGFGYLYYGLVRLYQPEVVVSIGSYRGFSTACLALGLVDNQKGTCLFIDPGKVDGFWHQPENAERLRQLFRLGRRWKHLRQTSQQAVESGAVPAAIDMLLIDGDHSYDGVRFDFDEIGGRVRVGGIILLHDSVAEGTGFTPWEVKRFLDDRVRGNPNYEQLTFPLSSGLTVVRKLA